MKTFLSLCFLIDLTATAVLLPAQRVPLQPLYTVDLSKSISQELDINPAGTLTFLTEKTLAVSICRNLRCSLETFNLEAGKPRQITSRTDEFPHYSSLFRAVGGRLILDGVPSGAERGAIILDSQLHATTVIPKAAGIRQSHLSKTGETFVAQDGNDWAAYKMRQPPERLLEGTGRVLSVSDEAVAYLDDRAVHVEGLDGKSLGSFAVVPKTLPTLRFLDSHRLWFEDGSGVEILDLNGKPIQKWDRPDGWGLGIGQSSDGSKILYDRYTRHIPLTQRIEEEAIAVATLGIGVGDEEPNGETILVIDTRSGEQCFEWHSPANLLVAGQFHADIDPSGRLVAIVTPTALNIYRLPEGCSNK